MVFVLRKLLQLVPVLIGISIVSFLVLHLTGDPAVVILGPDATVEAIEALREELGLNDPLLVQYLRFVRGAVVGDFGDSRSEEHTSELQSRENLVCRLLLEKKKRKQN